MEVGEGETPMLVGLKGLSHCYFPGLPGSEVWHPICKQAARAEKKLKVSKPSYFLSQVWALRFSRKAFLSVHAPKCVRVPLGSLVVTPTSRGFGQD